MTALGMNGVLADYSAIKEHSSANPTLDNEVSQPSATNAALVKTLNDVAASYEAYEVNILAGAQRPVPEPSNQGAAAETVDNAVQKQMVEAGLAFLADDHEAEEVALRQAVNIDPENTGNWLSLGMMKERRKDTEGARDAYHKVVQSEPANTAAWGKLGSLPKSDSNDDAARANHLQTAIELTRIKKQCQDKNKVVTNLRHQLDVLSSSLREKDAEMGMLNLRNSADPQDGRPADDRAGQRRCCLFQRRAPPTLGKTPAVHH